MVTPGRLGTLALLALLLQFQAEAFYVQIDAHGEECFFEQGMMGATVVLSFQVTQGGFLDIDVIISGPDKNVLFQLVHETSGQYSFTAYQDGPYKFCFSNRMSTITPKVVMFTIHMSHAPSTSLLLIKEDEEDRERIRLEEMIKELAKAIMAVKHEQEHMEVREKIHRAINEDTKYRVVLWSIFEAAILLAVTLVQIHYVRRFFHVQRTVIPVDNWNFSVEETTQEDPEGRYM
ncbi:transmembrane emp24 domain-containing protein 2-like [Notamacropus eugenii]|uniref:transmembrane emp24 domain-containing protein 2-like n=1 Tax=Notamacropus eugenii TaxID=9315 RepID=UPI003B684959